MVLDHERDHASRWAAVVSIAAKIGCAAQTLREWVKKAEVDSGRRVGVPTEAAAQLKALERENRELRQVNEILRKTLRHSIHTYLAARGVPKAQIDTAAGHSTDRGTGDEYNHLRPDYLKDFIAGIEAFWFEVDTHADVHRQALASQIRALTCASETRFQAQRRIRMQNILTLDRPAVRAVGHDEVEHAIGRLLEVA